MMQASTPALVESARLAAPALPGLFRSALLLAVLLRYCSVEAQALGVPNGGAPCNFDWDCALPGVCNSQPSASATPGRRARAVTC